MCGFRFSNFDAVKPQNSPRLTQLCSRAWARFLVAACSFRSFSSECSALASCDWRAATSAGAVLCSWSHAASAFFADLCVGLHMDYGLHKKGVRREFI